MEKKEKKTKIEILVTGKRHHYLPFLPPIFLELIRGKDSKVTAKITKKKSKNKNQKKKY